MLFCYRSRGCEVMAPPFLLGRRRRFQELRHDALASSSQDRPYMATRALQGGGGDRGSSWTMAVTFPRSPSSALVPAFLGRVPLLK